MRARAPGLSALLGHLAALSEDAAAWPAPCTTLTEAAVRGEAAAVAAFLDGGHDIDERTIGFASPLAAAAGRGHLEVVELLLQNNADPNIANERGATAIDWALKTENTDIADLLRKAGGRAGESAAGARSR